ncbi:hypothetical protein [Maribellus sediminis]|uniref:hypothetical protein n=1 Tax=Maribellus sediminis TaxID=2696285 RepID=UPI00142FBBC5|nr:hypothetical protein [Maribellus sediminis]
MIVKSMILGLLFTPLSLLAVDDPGNSKINEKLDVVETIIAEAEAQTAGCQMHSFWHFPVELYGYLNIARRYADNARKSKNLRKMQENLQCILAIVDESISGKEGYWSGNWNDVWVDPTPCVPDCALDSFVKMKKELETEIKKFL